MWQSMANSFELAVQCIVALAAVFGVTAFVGLFYQPHMLLGLLCRIWPELSPPERSTPCFNSSNYPGIPQWLASHDIKSACFDYFLGTQDMHDPENHFTCEICIRHVPLETTEVQDISDEEDQRSPRELMYEIAEAGIRLETAQRIGSLMRPDLSAKRDWVKAVYDFHAEQRKLQLIYEREEMEMSHDESAASKLGQLPSDAGTSSGPVSTSSSYSNLTALTESTTATSTTTTTTSTVPSSIGERIKPSFWYFTDCPAYCRCSTCKSTKKGEYWHPPAGAVEHWFKVDGKKRRAKGDYPMEARLVESFRKEYDQRPGTIERFNALLRLAYFDWEILKGWSLEYHHPFKPEEWETDTAIYEGEDLTQRQAIEREEACRALRKKNAQSLADQYGVPLADWAELEFKKQAPLGLQRKIYQDFQVGDARKVWALAVNAFMGFEALEIPSDADLTMPAPLQFTRRRKSKLNALLWKVLV